MNPKREAIEKLNETIRILETLRTQANDQQVTYLVMSLQVKIEKIDGAL